MESNISPITQTSNISEVKRINVNKIIKKYEKYGIDVRPYFKGITKISILKCNDTDYQYYYPFDISGDSNFYEHFQKYEWYYMPWKWEHEVTSNYLNSGMKILEVGCAHGDFLKKISSSFEFQKVVGLELNETTKFKNSKLEIINLSIQDFAKNNLGIFDLVCSFQVLEHISDVHSFLKAKIDCLRKDGILIISVPNNDSFIKDAEMCLNMPPHHLGLWNEKSLTSLQNIFPIKLLNIHIETLQEYHFGSYLSSFYYSKYPTIIGKILYKFNSILGVNKKRIKRINNNKNNIIGHTILIAFKKL